MVALVAATGAATGASAQSASGPAPETASGPQVRVRYYPQYLQLTWKATAGATSYTWEAGRGGVPRRFPAHVVAKKSGIVKVNVPYRSLPLATSSNRRPSGCASSAHRGSTKQVGRVAIPVAAVKYEASVNPARSAAWSATVINVTRDCATIHASTVVADTTAKGLASDLPMFIPQVQRANPAAVVAAVKRTKGGVYIGCVSAG